MDTPLPLRPLVCRAMRTMPSVAGISFDPALQEHLSFGWPQSGHIVPWSVEYTSPELLFLFICDILMEIEIYGYLKNFILGQGQTSIIQ